MTYQELIDRAYGHSTKNVPSEIATEDPELLLLAHRIFQALYTIGAALSPGYYGEELVQSGNGAGGWDQPTDADAIFYMEDPSGAEVVVVPIDEKDAEPAKPSVYSIGQVFKPADPSGTVDPDPTGDSLTIYHTVPPTEPTQLADSTPAEYPDNHLDLPILQVALYLTRKDLGGRGNEFQALSTQRNRELARYVTMLQNRLPMMRSRFSSPQVVKDRSLVSFRELLTGAIGGGS